MANLLDSSATTTTTSTAPGFYTNYLSGLASNATNAANNAQFAGATDLQNNAFNNVTNAGGAFQPTLSAAGNTLNAATTANSPLSAANPYLDQATSDVGATASGLMNPYMTNVVNAIGDAGQRNIQQNLAPGATAGAVGSVQFGSKRGAEVLGQTMSNADRDILNAQASALGTGYNTALQTALGEKQVANTAGSTAANAASAGQQNLTQAGSALGNLASTNQNLNLNDINAQATLGAQQQTINQNQQLFPLNNLSTLSGMLRGYSVPMSTTATNTAQMSPLSALAGATAGTVGLFTAGQNGQTPFDSLQAAYNKFTGSGSPSALPSGVYNSNSNTGTSGSPDITGGTDYSNTGSGSPSITSFPVTGGNTGGANDDPANHPGEYWDAYNNAWMPEYDTPV